MEKPQQWCHDDGGTGASSVGGNDCGGVVAFAAVAVVVVCSC